jgi:hypothetical protein
MTSASAEIPARIWSSVDVAKGVIRAVLDDRDPVPAGDLEKLPPPVQRQRAAGRVLERRDDVEQRRVPSDVSCSTWATLRDFTALFSR